MRSRVVMFGLVFPLLMIGCGKSVPTDNGGTTVPIDPKLTALLESLEPAEPNGEGATFVKPVMDVWKDEFAEKTAKRVKINYQPTGSGGGISQMTKKLVVFGCTDAPMT